MHPAMGEEEDPVRPGSEVRILSALEDMAGSGGEDFLFDGTRGSVIQDRVEFVQDKDLRSSDQCGRKCCKHLLAPRQGMGFPGEEMGNSSPFRTFLHLPGHILAGKMRKTKRGGYLVSYLGKKHIPPGKFVYPPA